MHCPDCGTKASGDQKFCRSCGMNLEKVHQLLADELTAIELGLQRKLRKVERWRNAVFMGALSSIAIVLISVFVREIKSGIENHSPELLPTVIGLAILIGLMATLFLVVYSTSLRERLTAARKRPSEISEATPTTKLALDSGREGMASVTEHTTEFIEAQGVKQPER